MAEWSIDDVIAKKRPVTQTVNIIVDGSLANEINILEDELARARREDKRHNRPPVAPALEQQLADLVARAEEMTVNFEFRGIGRLAVKKLQMDHPPTKEQLEESKQSGGPIVDVNPDTYPAALIAASCVSPSMTFEQAKDIWDSPDWNDGELIRLYLAARAVNEEDSSVPLSRRDTASMLNTLLGLTTPQNGESPTVFSTEGS